MPITLGTNIETPIFGSLLCLRHWGMLLLPITLGANIGTTFSYLFHLFDEVVSPFGHRLLLTREEASGSALGHGSRPSSQGKRPQFTHLPLKSSNLKQAKSLPIVSSLQYTVLFFHGGFSSNIFTSLSFPLRIQPKKLTLILDEVLGSAAAWISKTQGWRMHHKVLPKKSSQSDRNKHAS